MCNNDQNTPTDTPAGGGAPEAAEMATARGSSGSSDEVAELGVPPRPIGLLRATCAYGERSGSGEWPPPPLAQGGIVEARAVAGPTPPPGADSERVDEVDGKGKGPGANTASEEPEESSAARMRAGAWDTELTLRRPAPPPCDEVLAPGNDGARMNSVRYSSLYVDYNIQYIKFKIYNTNTLFN